MPICNVFLKEQPGFNRRRHESYIEIGRCLRDFSVWNHVSQKQDGGDLYVERNSDDADAERAYTFSGLLVELAAAG